MKPIAILGSGPAGLLAAHALGLVGYPMAIFSKPEKSVLGGAQFLHIAIPELTSTDPVAMIDIDATGDAATYRQKVYGDDPTVPFVSFPEEPHSQQPAWNLQTAYDQLWDIFGDSVTPADINPDWFDRNAQQFDLIISTIPLAHICRARAGLINEVHHFNAQKVWVATEAIRDINDNTMVYDGTAERSWYRMSRIFGAGSTEWSDLGPLPPYGDKRMLLKPIHTTCTCYPDVVKVGRHGSWKKGVLTHHAFVETLKQVLPEREVKEAAKA